MCFFFSGICCMWEEKKELQNYRQQLILTLHNNFSYSEKAYVMALIRTAKLGSTNAGHNIF